MGAQALRRNSGQQLRYSLGAAVRLEPGGEFLHQLHAPGSADAVGDFERLDGGRCCPLRFSQIEVAPRLVGQEHAASLGPAWRQQFVPLANELMGAAGVPEVKQRLPGVDSQVSGGHPAAPGGDRFSGRGIEQVLGCGERAQGCPPLSLCGESARETELEKGPGSRMTGSGQSTFKDAGSGARVIAPGCLVGEIAEKCRTQVAIAAGVHTVQTGNPILTRLRVEAVVEAVPADRLAQARGERVQSLRYWRPAASAATSGDPPPLRGTPNASAM